MNSIQARVSAGNSQGGQFASRARGEASVHLNAPLTPSSEAFGDQPSIPDSEYLGELRRDTVPA